MHPLAPSYRMSLIKTINTKLRDKYSSYRKVTFYLKNFQKRWESPRSDELNFNIIIKNDWKIDLEETLHNIDPETLIKIAIDLEIETPDFIPSFPVFKNTLKNNTNARHIFDIAYQNLEKNPSLSISSSNATLESVCKEIIKEYWQNYNGKDTLQKLVTKVLKIFDQYPGSNQDKNISQLGSSLLSAADAIENIRSSKTPAHGKAPDDLLIEDPLYAYFIINVVASIGLYINSFYKKFIKKSNTVKTKIIDDLPF